MKLNLGKKKTQNSIDKLEAELQAQNDSERDTLQIATDTANVWSFLVATGGSLEAIDALESIMEKATTEGWGPGACVTFDRPNVKATAHHPKGLKMNLVTGELL